MLRVSKRCRLLVSLLLLCGCFLSCFSGSAFAYASNDAWQFTGWYDNSIAITGKVNVAALSPVIQYSNYIDGSDDLAGIQVLTTNHISFEWINNYSDYLSLNISPLVLQVTVNDAKPGNSAARWTSDTVSIENCSPGLIVNYLYEEPTNSTSGQTIYTLYIEFADIATSSTCVFSPKSAHYYSFDLVVGSSFTLTSLALGSSTISIYENTNLGKVLNVSGDFAGAPSLTDFSVTPVPPAYTDSIINDSIQSQTQQQQQQHEEQMQQQQQQYDDFTDSGSSEGSDLIAGTEEDLKEKIGIFTFLDNLIQRFLGLFVASDASTSITLPAFSMNIQGRDYQIWNEYTFELSSLDGPFNSLMTAVRFATVATVYFAFLGYLQKTYKRIIGGSNG